jgi:hypothetical protein
MELVGKEQSKQSNPLREEEEKEEAPPNGFKKVVLPRSVYTPTGIAPLW